MTFFFIIFYYFFKSTWSFFKCHLKNDEKWSCITGFKLGVPNILRCLHFSRMRTAWQTINNIFSIISGGQAGVNTAWDQPSSYSESLTNTDKADYKRKLTLSTGELLSDPFTMKNWKCDESSLPDISWPDIYN